MEVRQRKRPREEGPRLPRARPSGRGAPLRAAALEVAAVAALLSAVCAPPAAGAAVVAEGSHPSLVPFGFRLQASLAEAAVPDSDRAVDRAREAQRRFERIRRRHLPTATPFSGPCDEVVGRFCFWHGDGREPPAEHPRVVEARQELIRTLDSFAGLAPEDGWVAGQRVRYLVEAGETARAARAARACASTEAGWCDALLGYASHAARSFERADSAFAAALRAMSEADRCEWTDVSVLLEGSARRDFESLACAERSEFLEVFWRLADPLWILPGNDRRTEHFARHVMDRLQEGAESGYAVRWGSDLRELLLRYGWPAGFERVRRPGMPVRAGRPDIQAYDSPGMRRFVPLGEWVADPPAAVEWEIDPRRPRSHYAPDYVRELHPLEADVAIFRRGEGAVVVGRLDLSASGGLPPACDSLHAGMGIVGTGPGSERRLRLATRTVTRAGDVLRIEVSPIAAREGGPGGEPLVLGLEALCPHGRVAFRSRGRLVLPTPILAGVGVSDLLLVEGRRAGRDLALPETLDEAIPRVQTSRSVGPGDRLVIFWELYRAPGPSRAGRVALSLTLKREGEGFFRRALRWVGLAGQPEDGPSLNWREAYPEAGVVPRAVAVSLPDLPAGVYRLELEVRSPGQEPLVMSQSLKVVEERVDAERGDG